MYFGGTAIGPTFSPASSRRCSAQVSSHASRLRSPESLYRYAARNGTASSASNRTSDCVTGTSGRPSHSASTDTRSASRLTSSANWATLRGNGRPCASNQNRLSSSRSSSQSRSARSCRFSHGSCAHRRLYSGFSSNRIERVGRQ